MNGPKPSIVIVDDEQGILDVVSRVARRAGYDASTYSNGRDAIAALQTERADLVLVDLRMPEIGGLDVLRAIRDTNPRCQAVLMTGYASVDTAVEAIKLGATDYLTVVTSQTAVLQTQLEALNLDTLQLRASVDLIRALGGGWEDSAGVLTSQVMEPEGKGT